MASMAKGNAAILELRTSMGLTQRDFGRRVGVSGPAICQLETGRTSISAETALGIADAFKPNMIAAGISVEDLIRGFRSCEAVRPL